MKFGDLVKNEWASDGNPTKVLMVVHHGKVVKCLSKTGKEFTFSNDSNLRLTKIGRVDFSKWLEYSSLLSSKGQE
ncbi:MAG: hypothetical protein GY787_12705 [Alteromonadales bacterium]|nr:hypothetical protein [Alteromonadales bacterium]